MEKKLKLHFEYFCAKYAYVQQTLIKFLLWEGGGVVGLPQSIALDFTNCKLAKVLEKKTSRRICYFLDSNPVF